MLQACNCEFSYKHLTVYAGSQRTEHFMSCLLSMLFNDVVSTYMCYSSSNWEIEIFTTQWEERKWKRSWLIEYNIQAFFWRDRRKLWQEVLGRTNSLFSLTWHGPHWKQPVQLLFYCCVCIHYRSNVSTDPLPSNDRGIFTEPSRCLATTGIFTESLPRNNRVFLPSRCLATREGYTYRHTDWWEFLIRPLRWAQVPWYTYQVS
jgi:hypothetical protein